MTYTPRDIVVVLPVIDPDPQYFRRYWQGVEPEVQKLFYIVDNSPNGVTKDKALDVSGAFQVDYEPQNLGVSASWNRAVKTGANHVIIACAGIRWLKGAKLVIRKMENLRNEYGIITNEQLHLAGFTRHTFELVGMFDEQFYPAYYEDTDFLVRLEKADIHGPNGMLPKFHTHDLYTTYEGVSNSVVKGLAKPDMAKMNELFVAKWGGGSIAEARFDTPYNNGGPLDEGCRVPWM